MTDCSEFLKNAIKMAKMAGSIHMKYFNKQINVKSKTLAHDKVTNVDIEAEQAIIAMIKNKFPSHNILAEEHDYKATASAYSKYSEYTWIIDPLDGTNNYAHSFPIFCVSIALARKEEVIVGVVYDPLRKELFYAAEGNGAFLNKNQINVSSNKELIECLLITGFFYDRSEMMIKTLKQIKKFYLRGITGLRRTGSAALDICYLACGRADGFWELKLSTWDFAAACYIVKQAGGLVTDAQGLPLKLSPSSILAANNMVIHQQMLRVLQEK